MVSVDLESLLGDLRALSGDFRTLSGDFGVEWALGGLAVFFPHLHDIFLSSPQTHVSVSLFST